MNKVCICIVCKKFLKVRSDEEFNQKVKQHNERYHPKLKLKDFETTPQLNLFKESKKLHSF
jgi:hypothetical protein